MGQLWLVQEGDYSGKALASDDAYLNLLSAERDGISGDEPGIWKEEVIDGQVWLRKALAKRQIDRRKMPRECGVFLGRQLGED
jgi:hypothetical protein